MAPAAQHFYRAPWRPGRETRQVLHRPPGMGYRLFQRATLKHTNWSILNPFVYHVMPGPVNLR